MVTSFPNEISLRSAALMVRVEIASFLSNVALISYSPTERFVSAVEITPKVSTESPELRVKLASRVISLDVLSE